MTEMLKRWRRLAPGDRRLLLETTACLLAVRLALRVVPVQRLRRALAAVKRPGVPRPKAAERVYWALGAVHRRLPCRCLPAALTAQFLLRRRGLDSHLRVGVRRGLEPRAHAWLELDDRVLVCGGGSLESYETVPLGWLR